MTEPLPYTDPAPPLDDHANHTHPAAGPNHVPVKGLAGTAPALPPLPHPPGAATVERGGAPHVIGVDVSLTATGIASSNGWWTTIGVDDLTTRPLPRRHAELWALGHQILDNIGRPDLVVIEAPAYSRSGAGMSERCGLWWRIVHALHARDIPVAEVMATTRIRYALGKGIGRKTAVVDAVARRWPQYATGGDDNGCDAVVLMAMGMDQLGHPLAAMPKTNRAALDAVQWPETLQVTP